MCLQSLVVEAQDAAGAQHVSSEPGGEQIVDETKEVQGVAGAQHVSSDPSGEEIVDDAGPSARNRITKKKKASQKWDEAIQMARKALEVPDMDDEEEEQKRVQNAISQALQKDFLEYKTKYDAKKNLKNTQCGKGAHLNLAPHLFSETASSRLSYLCTQDKTLEKKVVEEANKFIIAKGFPCVFRTRREADG